jgi:hypothetical protein
MPELQPLGWGLRLCQSKFLDSDPLLVSSQIQIWQCGVTQVSGFKWGSTACFKDRLNTLAGLETNRFGKAIGVGLFHLCPCFFTVIHQSFRCFSFRCFSLVLLVILSFTLGGHSLYIFTIWSNTS